MISHLFGVAGDPIELKGVAYDFGHAIVGVQFSLDGGEHWTTYPCEGMTDERTVSWSFRFIPERAGRYALSIRSVNDRGETSPESACVELEIEESS